MKRRSRKSPLLQVVKDWGGETFEDVDAVVAERHNCSVEDVRRERRRRGVSHAYRYPRVEDWGDETFEDPDEVVAIRHNTVPKVVRDERYRRKIFRTDHRVRNAHAVGSISGVAAPKGFTITVRGVEVKCDSIEALDAVISRYGDGGRGGGRGDAPARSDTLAIVQFPAAPPRPPEHKKCYRPRCKNLCPILASGHPANTCESHASPEALAFWEKQERLCGRPTIYPPPAALARAPVVSDKPVASKKNPPELAPTPIAEPQLRPTAVSEIAPASVEWLWRDRIPAGMLTVLYAAPGVGKGTLTATLAGMVTRGSPLPITGSALSETEISGEPGSALFVVAEDHPAKTLRPRLDAVGADTSRVHVFGPELCLKLPKHAAEIESAVREIGARLVVVDPLRGIVNGDSRSKVREALVALEQLAARTGAAVVVVHHTNRAGNIHGSQDILGIPRSVLLVSVDDSTGVRRVSQAKKNLAPDAEDIYYRIIDRGGVGAVEWVESPEEERLADSAEDEVPDQPPDALEALGLAGAQRPALEGGVMWDEGAAEPALVLEDVAELLGITARAIRVRMRRGTAAALVAVSLKEGSQRYWTRSAIALLVERGLEVVGKRQPGPPAGTGAKPEEEKIPAERVRGALIDGAGNVERAAAALGVSRAQLRRRIDELGMGDFAGELRETVGAPRFERPVEEVEDDDADEPAPKVEKPRSTRRRQLKKLSCACCGRWRSAPHPTCADCTRCRKVGETYESAGLCPKNLDKQVRQIDPKAAEEEMQKRRTGNPEQNYDPLTPSAVVVPARPKYEPF